jgi:hypothetical protein
MQFQQLFKILESYSHLWVNSEDNKYTEITLEYKW